MRAYKRRYANKPLAMWQQIYNMLDAKIFRLSEQAYIASNRLPDGTWRKRHHPYSIPNEAEDMVKMLGELGPETGRERCEEMAAYATSPGVNQKIYGSTL